jgi:hypothetical protein
MVMSAMRIGRRVVLAFMQGAIWTDEPSMFDYGFYRLFHPLFKGQSAPWGAKVVSHDIECLPSGQALSAVLSSSGFVRLVLWDVNVDGSAVTKLDESKLRFNGWWLDLEPPGQKREKDRRRGDPNPPGPTLGKVQEGFYDIGYSGIFVRDVKVESIQSGYVVARQKGPKIELTHWRYNSGTGFELADGPVDAGSARTIGLQRVHPNIFLLAKITPERKLLLESWTVSLRWGGGLFMLDSYTSTAGDYKEFDIAAPVGTDSFNDHRAVTASRQGSNTLVHEVWGVDPATGEITRMGASTETKYAEKIRIEAMPVERLNPSEFFKPSYYATAYRGSIGLLEIDYHSIATVNMGTPGNPIYPPLDRGGTAPTSEMPKDFQLAGLGSSGLFVAGYGLNGFERHTVWEGRREQNQVITPYLISENDSDPDITSLKMCSLETTHAEGDYAVAKTDSAGRLYVKAWRVGKRPY